MSIIRPVFTFRPGWSWIVALLVTVACTNDDGVEPQLAALSCPDQAPAPPLAEIARAAFNARFDTCGQLTYVDNSDRTFFDPLNGQGAVDITDDDRALPWVGVRIVRRDDGAIVALRRPEDVEKIIVDGTKNPQLLGAIHLVDDSRILVCSGGEELLLFDEQGVELLRRNAFGCTSEVFTLQGTKAIISDARTNELWKLDLARASIGRLVGYSDRTGELASEDRVITESFDLSSRGKHIAIRRTYHHPCADSDHLCRSDGEIEIVDFTTNKSLGTWEGAELYAVPAGGYRYNTRTFVKKLDQSLLVILDGRATSLDVTAIEYLYRDNESFLARRDGDLLRIGVRDGKVRWAASLGDIKSAGLPFSMAVSEDEKTIAFGDVDAQGRALIRRRMDDGTEAAFVAGDEPVRWVSNLGVVVTGEWPDLRRGDAPLVRLFDPSGAQLGTWAGRLRSARNVASGILLATKEGFYPAPIETALTVVDPTTGRSVEVIRSSALGTPQVSPRGDRIVYLLLDPDPEIRGGQVFAGALPTP